MTLKPEGVVLSALLLEGLQMDMSRRGFFKLTLTASAAFAVGLPQGRTELTVRVLRHEVVWDTHFLTWLHRGETRCEQLPKAQAFYAWASETKEWDAESIDLVTEQLRIYWAAKCDVSLDTPIQIEWCPETRLREGGSYAHLRSRL